MKTKLFLAASLLLAGMQISLHGFPMDGEDEDSPKSSQRSIAEIAQQNRRWPDLEDEEEEGADDLDDSYDSYDKSGSFLKIQKPYSDEGQLRNDKVKWAFVEARKAWVLFSDAMKTLLEKDDASKFNREAVLFLAALAEIHKARGDSDAVEAAGGHAASDVGATAAVVVDALHTVHDPLDENTYWTVDAAQEVGDFCRVLVWKKLKPGKQQQHIRMTWNHAQKTEAFIKREPSSQQLDPVGSINMTVDAWSHVIALYEAGKKNPPYWFSALWMSELQTAQEKKFEWLRSKIKELEKITYTSLWFEKRAAEQATNQAGAIFENPDKAMPLLTDVIAKASQVVAAQNEALKIYQQEGLAFKNSESFKEIEHQRQLWVDKISWFQLQKDKFLPWHLRSSFKTNVKNETQETQETNRIFDEAAESLPVESQEKDAIVERETKNFPGAILKSAEKRTEFEIIKRIVILSTQLKYPFIRIEETLDKTTHTVLSRKEMVADHFLITLPEGETEESLCKKLNIQKGNLNKAAIEMPFYRLHFNTPTTQEWDDMLKRIREIPGTDPEPDFLSHANVTKNQRRTFSPSFPLKKNNKIAPELQQPQHLVVVALPDSGVHYEHEELQGKMWQNPNYNDISPMQRGAGGRYREDGTGGRYGWNFVSNNGDPMDDNGHGTHCAGLIVRPPEDFPPAICSSTRVMALKCSNAENKFYSDTIAAIDYGRVNSANGVAFFNCSYGGNSFMKTEYKTFERAQNENDIILVASAGNEGKNLVIAQNPNYSLQEGEVFNFPASYPLSKTVVVAATKKLKSDESHLDTELIPSSNRGGETVDIAAPGEKIKSTGIWSWFNTESWLQPKNRVLVLKDGTSAAAPQVTRALALMKARFPNLSSDELIERLYRTASYAPELDGLVQGGRILNLARALEEN